MAGCIPVLSRYFPRRLIAVQEKVALLNAKVQELETQFKEANDDKEAAIRESERCQRKLELANRLINALASEGERWALTVEQLRKDYEVLTGACGSAIYRRLP